MRTGSTGSTGLGSAIFGVVVIVELKLFLAPWQRRVMECIDPPPVLAAFVLGYMLQIVSILTQKEHVY
jgi:hypothetical protein